METGARRLDKPTVLDDAASVYSYTSTKDVSQFVKEFHGRVFNNTNASYLLPADQAEWARLDKQGSALTIAFDGLYPCQDIVDAVLLPEEGCNKRILDVGCGTGAWALQMAIKFPHTSVLGIDVAPTPIDEASFPPNLSLQICDINLGLSHFEGQIDLLHMRCVAGGIHDMTQMLQELQKCLKPGGLLLVVDGDSSTLCEDRKTIMPLKRLPDDGGPEITGVSEQGSWLRRVLWEAREACQIAGSDLARADELYDLGLWDHPLCDPDTARSGGVDLPIGPWAKTEDVVETQLLKYAGTLMRQNLLIIHRAYHAILLNHGMDQETLDEWSRHVDAELNTLDPKGWIRFRFFMARRRAGEGLPAPPLPTSSSAQMGSQALVGQQRSTRSRYPAIDVYYTREDNLRRMQQRRSHGLLPSSAVGKAWAKKRAGL